MQETDKASFEILRDSIKKPGAGNTRWTFDILVNGKPSTLTIDAYDLNTVFKRAVGRYPSRESGDDQSKHRDILDNWTLIEPELKREFVKRSGLVA